MKKDYKKPELVAHGSVRSLTQVLGSNSMNDTLSIGGAVFGEGETLGSRDLTRP